MHIGEVFSNSKWELIKDLSEKKLSPIQLAEKYDTTPSNIGHQLRILQAYGLVKSEKIRNRDKGKPRTLFSMTDNFAYLAAASKNIAERKVLKLSSYHDTILKMWFIKDARLHYPIEKFYWKIEGHIDDINGIAVKINSPESVEVVILTSIKKELAKKIGLQMSIKDSEKRPISFNIKFTDISKVKSCQDVQNYHILYDPNQDLTDIKNSLCDGQEEDESGDQLGVTAPESSY